ncbi:hypothetical protein WG902_02755 [Ramlibacter sp. PS3R-8]|uniref:hypothetical protein n=1 Tax=Ramlibacter sp. PS3R-8 TaxID=3133437 RepID=UPI00309DA67E
MRAIFSILGLLLVVAVIGFLAKSQLKAGVAPAVPGAEAGSTVPAATPQQQVKQFEQAVQGAVQQARPMPDNDK